MSLHLSSIDKELEQKILESEKEILKKKENQMKSINEEINNITKITVAKISDLKLTNNDIDKAVSSFKGALN